MHLNSNWLNWNIYLIILVINICICRGIHVFPFPADIEVCIRDTCSYIGDVHVNVDESFNLTCIPRVQDTTLNNLTFVKYDIKMRELKTALGRSTLEITDAKLNDSGTYECLSKDEVLRGRDVFVGNKPKMPLLKDCVNHNGEWMQCDFDLVTSSDDLLNPFVDVYYRIGNSDDMACPLLNVMNKTATCIWKRTDDQTFANLLTYYITVDITTDLGTASNTFSIIPSQYLKPGVVENITVNFFNSSVMKIEFNQPSMLLCQQLYYTYRIQLHDYIGRHTEHMLDEPCTKQKISTTVNSLTPFVNYTVFVQVKPSDSGYWSSRVNLSICTPEAAPFSQPYISSDYFTVFTRKDKTIISIYWKKYSREDQGGRLVSVFIRIGVERSCGEPFKLIQHNQTYDGQTAIIEDVPESKCPHTVSLQLATVAGLSDPTLLVIPSFFEVPVKPTMVTTEKMNSTHYYISWNTSTPNLPCFKTTIHYCYGELLETAPIVKCLTGMADVPVPTNRMQQKVNLMPPFPTTRQNCQWFFAVSIQANGRRSGMIWGRCRFLFNGESTPPEFDQVEVGDTSIKLTWTYKCSTEATSAKPIHYELSQSHIKKSSDRENQCNDGTAFNVSINAARQFSYTQKLTLLKADTLYLICIRTLTRMGYSNWTYRSIRTSQTGGGNDVLEKALIPTCIVIFVFVVLVIVCTKKSSIKKACCEGYHIENLESKGVHRVKYFQVKSYALTSGGSGRTTGTNFDSYCEVCASEGRGEQTTSNSHTDEVPDIQIECCCNGDYRYLDPQ